MVSTTEQPVHSSGEIDGRHAWIRLVASLVIGAAGGVGLWSSVVLISATEARFEVDRADASLPYTATMLGILAGNILIGRMVDRMGVVAPVLLAAVCLAVGYAGAAFSTSLWQLMLFQGIMVGALGTSATFGPLIAAITLWFARYRGIAVAIAACGNYVAGAIWPPIIQYLLENVGWRDTHLLIAVVCFAIMVPMTLLLRRPPPAQLPFAPRSAGSPSMRRVPVPPNFIQALLLIAGIACCVAMAMPQVHIVAYCVDLDFDAARGAEMLALMLGLGVVSRPGIRPGDGPDRGDMDAAHRFISPGILPAVVLAGGRPGIALRGVRSVWPVSGRDPAGLRADCSRLFSGVAGRDARWTGSCRGRLAVWHWADGCRVKSTTRRCPIMLHSLTVSSGTC